MRPQKSYVQVMSRRRINKHSDAVRETFQFTVTLPGELCMKMGITKGDLITWTEGMEEGLGEGVIVGRIKDLVKLAEVQDRIIERREEQEKDRRELTSQPGWTPKPMFWRKPKSTEKRLRKKWGN